MQIETYGGIGNQCECIINAVLLTRELGLTGLILPNVQLVAHGFQDTNPNFDYKPPFNNRSLQGSFYLMFDSQRFIDGCRSIGVEVVEQAPEGSFISIKLFACISFHVALFHRGYRLLCQMYIHVVIPEVVGLPFTDTNSIFGTSTTTGAVRLNVDQFPVLSKLNFKLRMCVTYLGQFQ